MYVLGIDAGGTKTVCLLADGDGRVLAQSHGAGANLQASGELEVEKVLHRVMEDTLGQRDVRPDAICPRYAGLRVSTLSISAAICLGTISHSGCW